MAAPHRSDEAHKDGVLRGKREMDYPNRKRLVLAVVVVAACSVWLAAGMTVESKAKNDAKPQEPPMTVTWVAADGQTPKPAHQSVAVESRGRTPPVPGD
jgi:hypothetical protein